MLLPFKGNDVFSGMKSELSVDKLLTILNSTPVIADWDPWLRLKLELAGVAVYSCSEFKRAIDRLEPIEDKLTVVFADQTEGAYGKLNCLPAVRCKYDPFEDREFEESLAPKFEVVCSSSGILKQSMVSDHFLKSIDFRQPLLAALLIIDGLSFIDFRGTGVHSCLVDGASLTPSGLRRIVGFPHVAKRLFDRGYYRRIGFSYWDRKNELTDKLFYLFAEGQLHKAESFDVVLSQLEEISVKEKTYIQIFRAGLDGYAHNHRDRPPKDQVIRAIKKDIENLVGQLQTMTPSFVLLVTADHGILWTESVPSEAVYLNERAGSLRYYAEGERIPDSVARVGVWHSEDRVVSLPANWFRRKPRVTEWGCHGGISIAESFVPLILYEG